MDKDIHNEIEEEIEGIVYDDNDTDAKEESVDGNDKNQSGTEPAGADDSDKDEGEPESAESGEDAEDEGETESENVDESDEAESKSEPESEGTDESGKAEAEEFSKEQEEESRQQKTSARLLQARRAALRRRLRNNKLALIIPAIAIIIIAMVCLFVVIERNQRYNNLLNVDYFYEGVYVDDISLGGLTKEEARQKLDLSNKLRSEQVKIELLWDGETIAFGGNEVKVAFNTEQILEAAWQEGRNGTDRERYDYVMSIAENPIYFTTEINVNPAPIEAKIKAVALFRQRDPGEASVKFNPDPEIDGAEWFEYAEPQKGIETDPEGLWESVKESLIKNAYAAIEIPKWEIEPTTTIEDLKNMTQRIVQFKTHMVRNSNREHNVALACSMINGTVLMPGEIFSMNDTTGKRTKAAGFREANVIVGGNRLEPGIAGGVCQVSGTLFNAAVRADLEIVERYHHSFELSYLTRGRDATVNYGTADLRFKNTSDYPIYISMYTVGRDVYSEIYGMPLPDGMTIELYVKTTKTIAPGLPVYVADSSVPYGTTKVYSAKTGIKCTTYKDYYDADGKLVDRVELQRDYYRPYPQEIHYNPASGMPPAS